MKRREFISLTGGAVAWPLVARAQLPRRVVRVGILVSGSPPDSIADGLRRNLRDLGYSEGQNIAFEVRFAMDRSDRAAEVAQELVRLDVDIIVAHFTPAAIAAKEATRTIPIVMSSVGAPVENGLVESLARPGGNVMGQSNLGRELASKRLELLRQVIPSLSRLAVLVSASATNPYTRLFVHEIEAGAVNAGIRVDPILVDGPSDLENAFTKQDEALLSRVADQIARRF
jgi:putative ABC transport system substrate-binding protein